MGAEALAPVGRYLPMPMYGVCGRPLTTSNTHRPAAFVTTSAFSATGIRAPLLDHAHGLGSRHELQSAVYHWRINHLRTQAHHAQTLFLCFVVGGENLARTFDLVRCGCERFVNDRDLRGVEASHAFEAEATRMCGPRP